MENFANMESIAWDVTDELADSLGYKPPYKVDHTYRMSVVGGDKTRVNTSDRFGNLQLEACLIPLDADGREGSKSVLQWYSSPWQPANVEIPPDAKRRDMKELIGILQGRGLAQPGNDLSVHKANLEVLKQAFRNYEMFVGPCGYADYVQFTSKASGKTVRKFQNFRATQQGFSAKVFPLVDSF